MAGEKKSIFDFADKFGYESPFGYDWVREDFQQKIPQVPSGSRYDFLPVVKVNPNESTQDAIISINECSKFPKAKINLGTDYDKNKREYIVADIIIAQNSISRIPLMIKRGYDPWGFQDEDGVLTFNSSSNSIKMNFIDSSQTNYNNEAKKYDLKNASNGDRFVMELETKKSNGISSVPRGASFTISIYASDNNDKNKSNRKGICGKFNVKIVEKDVFLQEEEDVLLATNESLVGNDKICFRVADKELAKLFNNPKLVLNSYFNINGFDRMTAYKNEGYVKSTKYFNQSDIWVRQTEDGYNLKPQRFRLGSEKVFFEYINSEVKGRIGFHLYYFVLLKGYHVLLLLVDNSDLCNPKFIIIDQIRIRKWVKLDDIDSQMLEMTRNNYIGACDDANRKDIDSSIQLWKLTRK